MELAGGSGSQETTAARDRSAGSRDIAVLYSEMRTCLHTTITATGTVAGVIQYEETPADTVGLPRLACSS
jgi:hypothetical protein